MKSFATVTLPIVLSWPYGAAWRLRRGHCLIWAIEFPRISCGLLARPRLCRPTQYRGVCSRTRCRFLLAESRPSYWNSQSRVCAPGCVSTLPSVPIQIGSCGGQERQHRGRVEQQGDDEHEPPQDGLAVGADPCCQIPHAPRQDQPRRHGALPPQRPSRPRVGEGLRLNCELVGKAVDASPAVVRGASFEIGDVLEMIARTERRWG
jgi:hypothetical protein